MMYIRWRLTGSEVVWFWLARIIKGSSQHVRTSRGVDSGSVAIHELSEDHPVSEMFFNHDKLTKEMQKLCVKVVGHNQVGLVSQAVGISISVGIKIISIVVSLGFVGDRSHGCGQ